MPHYYYHHIIKITIELVGWPCWVCVCAWNFNITTVSELIIHSFKTLIFCTNNFMHYVCILSIFLIYVNVHGCSHKKPTLTGHFRGVRPSLSSSFVIMMITNLTLFVVYFTIMHPMIPCMPVSIYVPTCRQITYKERCSAACCVVVVKKG